MAEAKTIAVDESAWEQLVNERLQQRAEIDKLRTDLTFALERWNIAKEAALALGEDIAKYRKLADDRFRELEKVPREIAAWLEQNVESVYHDESPVAAALTQAATEIRELAWKQPEAPFGYDGEEGRSVVCIGCGERIRYLDMVRRYDADIDGLLHVGCEVPRG